MKELIEKVKKLYEGGMSRIDDYGKIIECYPCKGTGKRDDGNRCSKCLGTGLIIRIFPTDELDFEHVICYEYKIEFLYIAAAIIQIV